MSINIVAREGNLAKAPTYFAGAGEKKSFASLRVASYGGKDKDGNKLTIWATVKCYGFLADQIKDLDKGDTVVFAGRVVADPYDGADGQVVESESIIADSITYRKKGENSAAAPEGSEKKATKKAPKTKDEAEIPF